MRNAIREAVRRNATFLVMAFPLVVLSVASLFFDNQALRLKLREAERANAAKHAMSLEDRHEIRLQLEAIERRLSKIEQHAAR